MLTKRQKQTLDYIAKYIKENNYAPSLEEVRRHFRLSSIATVHQHIEILKEKGYLNKLNNQPRGIEIAKIKKSSGLVDIPLVGTITAGEPIETYETPENISVSKNLLTKGGEHFALKVSGTA